MSTKARNCAKAILCGHSTLLAIWLLIPVVFASEARADIITEIGGGGTTTRTFAVLYTGGNGNQLQISQGTINGNIGVGGTGDLKATGSGAINGNVYFAPGATLDGASNKTINGSLYYNDTNIGTDLSDLQTLSTTVSTEVLPNPVSVAITGTTTLNASSAPLDSNGNRVFNVTSFNLSNSTDVLTIQGDGNNVVLNVNSDVSIFGSIVLTNGLTPDQLLINVIGGHTLTLQHNTVSGDFLDLNGAIMVSGETLNGRLFGGDSDTMKIVSDSTFAAPTGPAPEPISLVLSGTILLGLVPILKRKLRRTPRREVNG